MLLLFLLFLLFLLMMLPCSKSGSARGQELLPPLRLLLPCLPGPSFAVSAAAVGLLFSCFPRFNIVETNRAFW